MRLSGPAHPQEASAALDPLARSDLQTLLSCYYGSESEYLKNACQIPARQARQDRWGSPKARSTRLINVEAFVSRVSQQEVAARPLFAHCRVFTSALSAGQW